MEVILIKDVDNLGASNEVVNVKNGYARNYLIPQKFAIEANPTNRKKLDETLRVQAKKEAAVLAEANKVRDALQESVVTIGAKTGTSGKIFGSVTSLQISRAIQQQKGFMIDRKRINILDDVKELGTYKASVDLGNNNIVEVQFEVVAE